MLKTLEADNLQPNDHPIFPYNTSDTLKVIGKFVGTLKTGATQTQAEVIAAEEDEQTYPEVFNGAGNLKDCEIKLHIDNNVTPVAQTNRRIPFHFRKKVEDDLNRLEKEGIIEKVTGPTSWISPTVIVPKI
ncbi:hypothetical protein Trydic_g3891 [Trypoxylus dichotomus]